MKKRAPLFELLGAFVLFIGAGFVVAAAAMVSVALACLAAGVFLIFAGIITAYFAAVLDREPPKPARSAP